MSTMDFTRRKVLKTGTIAGAGLAVPTIFTASSAAAYMNEPTALPARRDPLARPAPTA